MRMTARVIASIVALVTLLSPFMADYDETHLFNPAWPPHAKFHDAITIQLGVLLGVLALLLLWRRTAERATARTGFVVALWAASFYWIALIGANFFPGTSYVDPEFAADLGLVAGVLPPQVFLAGVLLVLLVVSEVLWRTSRQTRSSTGGATTIAASGR